MLKKCTASHCRRIFDTTNLVEKSCPFCGKRYPRMSFSDKGGRKDTVRFDIVLVSYNQRYPMIYTARCIGRLFGWGPGDSINAVKHLPFTLATGLHRNNAAEIKGAIEKVGGTVKVVPRR